MLLGRLKAREELRDCLHTQIEALCAMEFVRYVMYVMYVAVCGSMWQCKSTTYSTIGYEWHTIYLYID